MIVIGGMIGLGKTTTSTILSQELNLPVFYESVDDNKVLPLFYSASKEEQEKYRYPFLLQLNFLSSRFHSIKKAMLLKEAILDRSIYEDVYFAKKNHDLGRISDLEFEIYQNLFHEMMDEIRGIPSKSPEVMVYLKGSFETCLSRIGSRGREFELDPALKDYYYFLWKDYDEWVKESYKASPVIIVDVDQRDIKCNKKDREWLLSTLYPYIKKD